MQETHFYYFPYHHINFCHLVHHLILPVTFDTASINIVRTNKLLLVQIGADCMSEIYIFSGRSKIQNRVRPKQKVGNGK